MEAVALTSDPIGSYLTKIGNNAFLVEGDRIAFLDSRFYRTASGAFVPSVTTVLEAYPKGAQYYEWLKKHGQDSDEIRDEAGRRGSVIHEATELLDRGGSIDLMHDDGTPKFKLSEWAMISRWVEFRKAHPSTVHAIESKLTSDELGYAGTLDRVMTIKSTGKTYLVDIKTGASVWSSYWLQQAAYHQLLHTTGYIAKLFPDGEVPEIHLAILHLNAKTRSTGKNGAIQGTGWQFVEAEKPTAHYMDLFNKTHGLWLAEHEGEKPRTTSYALSMSIK